MAPLFVCKLQFARIMEIIKQAKPHFKPICRSRFPQHISKRKYKRSVRRVGIGSGKRGFGGSLFPKGVDL
jgi:hypothetical protein